MTSFKSCHITEGVKRDAYLAPVDESGAPIPRGDPRRPLSRSDLVQIHLNPRRWLRGYEPKETDAMEWGEDMDMMALTPDEAAARYVVAPESYPVLLNRCPKCGSESDAKHCKKCGVDRAALTVNKEWNRNATYCRDWEKTATAHGKSVLTAPEYEARTLAVARLSEAFGHVIATSKRQVMVSGVLQAAGGEFPVRALLDLVPFATGWESALADLKEGFTADPRRYGKHIEERKLFVQAAFYLDLWNAANPDDQRTDFAHIVQENFPPFEVMDPPGFLSGDHLQAGRLFYADAAELYVRCLKLPPDKWPGYAPHPAALPSSREALPKSTYPFQQIVPSPFFTPPEPRPVEVVKSEEVPFESEVPS